MATPHEYYLSVIGKGFDEDRAYGVQCVDGFKHFCRTILGYNISHRSICSPTGFATSIWDNFEKLGLNKYFDKVPSNQMVDGDWAIWNKGSRPCPSSHVAMFRKDNGNGTGIFLGQNQGRTRNYSQINISYSGIRGGLRPKCYHQSNPQPSGSGKNYINLKPTVDTWRIYPLDKAPKKGNEKGFLKPKKYCGLTYYIYKYHDNGATAEIQTSSFGRGKIYIKDVNCSVTIDNPIYEHGEY